MTFDRRKAILTTLAAVLLLAASVFFIGEAAKFHEMARALRRADKWWFALCLVGELLAYAGYIAAYRDFARVDGGPRFS